MRSASAGRRRRPRRLKRETTGVVTSFHLCGSEPRGGTFHAIPRHEYFAAIVCGSGTPIVNEVLQDRLNALPKAIVLLDDGFCVV